MLSFKQFLLESISDRVKNINRHVSEIERISGGFQPGGYDYTGLPLPPLSMSIADDGLPANQNLNAYIRGEPNLFGDRPSFYSLATKQGLTPEQVRSELRHEFSHLINSAAMGVGDESQKEPKEGSPRGKRKNWHYEILPKEKRARAIQRVAPYWEPKEVDPELHKKVAGFISQGKSPQEALNMVRYETLRQHMGTEIGRRSPGIFKSGEQLAAEVEKRMKQGNFPKEVFKTTSLALQQAETRLPDLNDPSVRDEFLRQHGYGAKGTSTGTTKPPVDVTPSVPVKPKGMSPGTKLGVATAAIAPIVALSQGANAGEAWEATKQSILDPSNYNPLSILDGGNQAGLDSDGTPRPGTPAYDDYQKELARQEMGYRSAEAAKRRAADAERFKQAGFASNPLEPIRKTK
jgi:hypothetical protein